MPAVTNAQLLTLINTTLPAFKPQSLQVAYGRNKYEVTNRWWKEDKVIETGGNEIQDRIILDENGSARHVSLFEATQPNASDQIAVIKMPWTYAQSFWVVERREILQNMSPRQIVKLMKARRIPAAISMANMLEADGWAIPDPTSDKAPYSIRYFVPQLAAGQAGEGFYGGCPAGFASVANIAPCTSGSNTTAIAGGKPNWRSYSAGGTGYYVDMNMEAVFTMVGMFISVQFEAPMLIDDLKQGPLAEQRIYVNKKTLRQYERLVSLNNDNLNSDLAKFHGITVFKNVPIKYIPDLDADDMDPVYMIDHTTFMPYVLEGDNMRESEAIPGGINQPNVFVTFTDHTYQYFNNNRQRNGVMNKTA